MTEPLIFKNVENEKIHKTHAVCEYVAPHTAAIDSIK